MIYLLLYSSGLFFTGFTISFAIVGCFLSKYNNIYDSDIHVKSSIYKDYLCKYPFYDIENMEPIENMETIDFDNNIFTEDTPSGKVIMKYNKNTDFFEYYSDRHISNRLLEVVCRGYVLEFNCKNIYTNYNEEFTNRHKVLQKYHEKLKENEKEKQEKQEKQEKHDVFATFKSYNTKKNEKSSAKSDILVKQQYNKFKYLGKLSDVNQNVNNFVEKTIENISYEKFKTM